MPTDPDGSSSAPPRLPPPSTTQVQAHRFAVRRLESALVGRDPTPRHDPGRRQNRALLVGAVLGVLVLVGFAVVGLVRGDEDWRDEAVVRGEPSGALYAVAHGPDRLVPALNLTSARLLAAAAGNEDLRGPPVPVRDDLLAQAPRTAPAGIPGAPAVLPDPAAPAPDAWAVCDRVTLDPSVPDPAADPALTTVALGGIADPGRPLAPDEALLLRAGDAFWLVTDGRRARIDPGAGSGSVVRGLELTGARARIAGPALLGALPEAPPLVPVTVPGTGAAPTEPRTAALGVNVGTVVSPDNARFYLVADRGVQEVAPVIAQLARFANTDPRAEPGITALPARLVDDAPRVTVVDVRAYPATVPRLVTYDAATTVCVRPDATGAAAVFAAPALPGPAAPTPLLGPPLDGAWVAGGGAHVVPQGPGAPAGTAVLVDAGGRVYPVPDPAAAAALGLGTPRPAPRAVLDLLPRGPSLDPLAAQTAR